MAGFTVNRGGLYTAIHHPAGRPVRDLIRRADAVVSRAKIDVPVDKGYLRSTIRRSAPRRTAAHQSTITIAAGAVYAAAIHEGRGSQYAPPSWHTRGPGPRRFLTNALTAAGGRIVRRAA